MIYRILRQLLCWFFSLRYSLKVHGREEIDFKGPLLIASNHVTNFDPFVIHCAVPVHMAFMAKEELFKIPILGWIMKREKAISVRRGAADRQAIKEALNALREGRILGIFPEGTRNKSGELQKFQPGMTMLAVKSGSPVLPIWLDWTQSGKLKVQIGNVLRPPGSDSSREEQEQFTDRVREAILELSRR